MKKYRFICVLVSIFIILQGYTNKEVLNENAFCINYGQAIFEKEKFNAVYMQNSTDRISFRYSGSINIFEKILTMQILFFIMGFYLKQCHSVCCNITI